MNLCKYAMHVCLSEEKVSEGFQREREKKATKIMMATFGVDVNRCCQLTVIIVDDTNIDFSKKFSIKFFHPSTILLLIRWVIVT